MARIAVAGFQHETNTFAPTRADYDAFARPDAWPGLSRGPALIEAVAGINLPAAGFIEAARADGHVIEPVLWCSATPSAQVTEDAFERIAGAMTADLRALLDAGPLDAVYLDLHGAMVCEHLEDGEGELLRRLRRTVKDTPIVASLDLHANVTQAMIDEADALVAYRTYPHVDMAETGACAYALVERRFSTGRRPAVGFRKLDFMIPVTAQCTMIEPARSLYRLLGEMEEGKVWSASFTPGFPPADIAECGPAVFAVASSQAAAEAAAERLAQAVGEKERAFEARLWSPEAAVAHAKASNKPGPVVLADTQDNPGAGADADTVGLLRALVEGGARGAVLGVLYDPPFAAAAHRAGVGAELAMPLGERSGLPGHAPFGGRFLVERLGDGRFTGTGLFYLGARIELGPMALVRVLDGGGSEVRVIVSSEKFQAADQSAFRHLGVEPKDYRILALKSSVHFRADFEPIASEVLVVAAPGPALAEPKRFPYRRLRKGIRLAPDGPVSAGPASGESGYCHYARAD
ncbi:MAG: M81 family metallopeptidase [Alphaproteobacteria bacterium]